jgi:hypothetical protein
MNLTKGDKIVVISGQYSGRTGGFIKPCSSVFPDYCRIALDLKGRERNQKVLMIRKDEIQLKDESTI